MRSAKTYFSALALVLLFGSTTLVLNGCQSTAINELAKKTHGSKAGDGYTYGTGPNKTKPYPQSEPVNISGVGGAKPRFEPLSSGGNSDYRVLGQTYIVWTDCQSYQEVGTASWYGPGFHGNKTSNGEYYDQKGYTAAHKNLPLPSYVKVTNLENGKMVIVRVNDRGPFHGSRIIDLSEGAAKAIDMTKKGTARVKLELINTRTNNTTTEGGHGTGAIIAQGVINEIITNNTSSTTRNNLEKLGNYFDEKKANGEVSNSTKVAAIGAGLYFAGKVGSALAEASEDSGSSSNTSKSLVSSNSRSSNSVTSTITTTTTNSLGETTTNQTVSTKSFAPSNTNYEIDYALPPPQVNTTTTSNTSVASGSLVDAATGKALASGSYVQLFSSSTLDGATKAKTRIAQQTSYPVVIMAEDGLFRVRIGPVPEMSIGQALEQMRQAGYADAFIKHL